MRMSDWSSDVCSSDLVDGCALMHVCIAFLGIEHAPRPDPRHGQQQDDEHAKTQREPGADLEISHDYLVNTVGAEPGSLRRRSTWIRLTLFAFKIGRSHVCTPVTNAHLVCRLLLDNKNTIDTVKQLL